MREITNMDELKQIQYEILRDVAQFCEEHGIQYFLSHGTLLGAVRHGGFIPWDDDIDIYMKRSDYVKFCEEFPGQTRFHNLELVNAHTKTCFLRPMSKIINTQTVVYETDYIDDTPIGVFIDIWPLDGVPQGKLSKQIHMSICRLLQRVFYLRISKGNQESFGKEIAQKVVKLVFKPKKLVIAMEKMHQKYQDGSSQELLCYMDPYNTPLPASWFRESAKLKFETGYYEVPKEYDSILRAIYGDYMKLPPEEKRQPHHVMNTFWRD